MRTAGRSWWLLGGLGALAVAQACTRDPVDTGLDARVAEALSDYGPQVFEPGLAEVVAGLDALDAALPAWQSGGDRSAAQAAWIDTMRAWQRMELAQVGPAASSLSGGEDLRDEIYSWPTVNPCRVDQETVEQGYYEPDFFEANLANSYGLDALEHLLFAGDDTDCPSQVGIDEAWEELGPSGIDANRSAYAATVSAGVRSHLETLSGTEPAELDELFGALFYLDTVTKDQKLADVLDGEDAEHLPSGLSTVAIEENLRGFRRAFTGGEGIGLDDLLEDVGHGDLAEEILAETDEAIAVAEGLEGAIPELSTQEVQGLHDAIKDVTDLLKGDLATVLSLAVPSDASGDAD